jgi:hypothetical protein
MPYYATNKPQYFISTTVYLLMVKTPYFVTTELQQFISAAIHLLIGRKAILLNNRTARDFISCSTLTDE